MFSEMNISTRLLLIKENVCNLWPKISLKFQKSFEIFKSGYGIVSEILRNIYPCIKYSNSNQKINKLYKVVLYSWKIHIILWVWDLNLGTILPYLVSTYLYCKCTNFWNLNCFKWICYLYTNLLVERGAIRHGKLWIIHVTDIEVT